MLGRDLGTSELGREMEAIPAASLRIGAVSLSNRVILAPMSGITDAPFRRLAERLGAGLVVSEMTACAGLARGEREASLRSEGAGISTNVVQLAGCEAVYMAEGARIAEAQGAAVIDINMGCPSKQVTNGSCRLRADARSRPCSAPDRGDGCRCRCAGHAEDAAGLGRRHHQRA